MDSNIDKIETLITEYLTGSIKEDELSELIGWINQSKKNQQYFDDFRQTWLASKIFRKEKMYNSESAFNKFQSKIIHKEVINRNRTGVSKKFSISVFQAAASIIILLTLSVGTYYFVNRIIGGKNKQMVANQTIVPLGSKSKVILPDGSVVTLNAGSKLSYDIMSFGKIRRVKLEGEGYFKVHSDEKSPFIVNASGINIKATGTEFNVKAYPEDKIVETILVEGIVKIGNEDLIYENENYLTLKPDERFIFNKHKNTGCVDTKNKQLIGKEVILSNLKENEDIPLKYVETDSDPEAFTSWKEKHWRIDREPLESLAIKLERKYAVTITFADKELKKFKFNGTLEDELLEQVLDAMSLASPIRYKIEGRKVVIYENKAYKAKYKDLYISN